MNGWYMRENTVENLSSDNMNHRKGEVPKHVKFVIYPKPYTEYNISLLTRHK